MKKIFKKIYLFIDKFIIVPLSRLIFNIQNLFKRNSGVFDKLLNRPSFLLYLSLALAIVLFLLIDTKAVSLVENNAEVITNVPVTLKYNEEAYVIEGAPSTVDITISGRKSDIYLAKQLGEFEVSLDLSKYKASDSAYKAYFTYTKSINNLTYKLDPSYVQVMVRNKVSSVASVNYELINQDKLNSKLSVKSVALSKSEVVVKGSESALKEIASIKALVDLSDSDLTEEGTYDLDNVKLVAYNNEGNIMNNIEIVPEVLSATVVLDGYHATIPVEIKTVGSLIPGKAIASILINNQNDYSLTVYGSESVISSLKSIPVSIDVDGQGKNSVEKKTVTIVKPTGVRYMSANSLSVALTFGDEDQKTINISNISKKNLGSGYSVNIISSTNVSVTCKGVTSVLDKITEKDINAYVDLAGLGLGDHDVEVKIDNNNPLVTYQASSTIRVRISNS